MDLRPERPPACLYPTTLCIDLGRQKCLEYDYGSVSNDDGRGFGGGCSGGSLALLVCPNKGAFLASPVADRKGSKSRKHWVRPGSSESRVDFFDALLSRATSPLGCSRLLALETNPSLLTEAPTGARSSQVVSLSRVLLWVARAWSPCSFSCSNC